MSQRAQTKDQRFLLRLYELAEAEGDIYIPFNRYDIGEAVGLQKRAIETICRSLLQCNFIKKSGDEAIHLTPNGVKLVSEFLERS